MKKYGWFIAILLIAALIFSWNLYQKIVENNLRQQEKEAIKKDDDKLIARLVLDNNATGVVFEDKEYFTIEIQDILGGTDQPVLFKDAKLKDIYIKDNIANAIFVLRPFDQHMDWFEYMYLQLSIQDIDLLNKLMGNESNQNYCVVFDLIDVKRINMWDFELASSEETHEIVSSIDTSILVHGILIDFGLISADLPLLLF